METLTLEHIAPYLPYGLKIDTSYYDNEEYSTVTGFNNTDLIVWDGQWASTYGKKIEQDYYLGHVKPILRPIDLTKPITVDGKEIIPIVDLAKLSCNVVTYGHEFELENNGDLWCNLYNESGGVVVWCLIYNVFHGSFRLYEDEHNYDQLVLFQWLFKHKFDVLGLIEKGLVIDVNTLENNPYE